MTAARALAWRTLADARIRTLSFALLFLAITFSNAYGYEQTYPTVADRVRFAQTYGENKAARLFYGTPHRLETIGGYTAWRAGGLLTLFAAFFGLYGAVRVLRGEEDAGRYELVAAGAITRPAGFTARIVAIGVTIAVLWLATLLGCVAGGLPAAGSAYLALAVITSAAVYAGAGAVASQLMPSSRGALELGGALLGLDFLLRVVADTAGVSGLHWVTPLGWVEELRPFAGPRPAVLLLPAAITLILLAVSSRIERSRDIGAAVFREREGPERPRLFLLGSATQLALRTQVVSLAVWVLAVAGFASVIGTVSKSVSSLELPENVREQVSSLGVGDIATPSGYIGLTFLFFVLTIALFCCSQVAAARGEEAEGRLETLFALPESRIRWLAGRLALAAAGATLIALTAGIGAAAGATAVGVNVSFTRLIGAGLNCLPASLLFLGIAALLFAIAPRAGVGAAYGLVAVAFVWELVGAIAGAPDWLLGVSPFHQIGLVPAAEFRAVPAAVMLALGVAAAAGALVTFRRRDLTGV